MDIQLDLFQQLCETTTDVVVLVDDGDYIRYANPAMFATLGYAPEELIGQELTRIIPPRFRHAHHEGLKRFVRTRTRTIDWGFRTTYALHRDGHEVPIEATYSYFESPGGPLFAGIIRDITNRRHAEEKIRRLNRLYTVLSGINSTIVRVHERRALCSEVCRIAVELGQFGMAWIGWIDENSQRIEPVAASGLPIEQLAEMQLSTRPDLPEGRSMAGEAVRSGQPIICNDMRTAMHVGLLRGVALAAGFRAVVALPLHLDNRVVAVLVLYAQETGFFDDAEMHLLTELSGDISFALQYIRREEQLQYLSYYDALTGLPNRTLFLDRLGQCLVNARHDDERVAVVMLDVVHFKHFNDTLGRHVGDLLLKQIGQRLGQSLQDPYCLARLTADKFAVALASLPQSVDAAHIVHQRLLTPLNQPFATPTEPVQLTPAVGVALFPVDGQEAETLVSRAEWALKQARTSGEACCYYAPAINARIAERMTLERALRTALSEQQFVLHYQPRVSLASGRIVGAEALIRWQHPDWGLVPPDRFIPLAEESGLIVAIGDWVLDAVGTQLQAWQASWAEVPPVAVNLSAVQLRKGNVLETVRHTLTQYALPPMRLELELTESAVMQDPANAITVLEALSQLGVALALDDFGTGYSSLAYLKRFPFDVVKIDRSFVIDIIQSEEDAAIATAIIAMAHALKLRVVAEGVETVAQLNYLRQLNCDEIQGYYFSRPLPADAYAALVCAGRCLEGPD